MNTEEQENKLLAISKQITEARSDPKLTTGEMVRIISPLTQEWNKLNKKLNYKFRGYENPIII